MNFKIPEIKLDKFKVKLQKKEHHDDFDAYNTAPEDINDPDDMEEPEETAAAEEKSAKPKLPKLHMPTFAVSEDQLRPIWAGEIGISLIAVLTAVIIAIAA